MNSPLATIVFGLLGLTCVEAVRYGNNWAPVRRDSDQVAANFQNTSQQLLSPAFLAPYTIPRGFFNGSAGPTNDRELDYFLRDVADRHTWASYNLLDFKSEDGRAFPTLFLSTSSQGSAVNDSSNKVRVWIQAAVHGNEPAGDQSAMALIGKMDANETWAASLLEHLDIFVLPRYNPDGVANFQRTLLTNFDPNRDHIKLARQQTRDIKRVFSNFAPHVAIDMHEYGASPRYGGTYQQAADGLFSAAKNLNIHVDIRELSEQLFAPAIGSYMDSRGLRWEPYVTATSSTNPNVTIAFAEAGSDAKIGRNALGLTQCITFLTETRGIGIADQEFQRRTAASLSMVEAILQTAADNAEDVYTIIESAISDFSSNDNDVIVTDYTAESERDFTLVNSESGAIEQVPILFRSTTPTTANLTRPRPEAYLIPKAWADLASRLEDSGLEVKELRHKYRGTAEVLTIATAEFDTTYYEGVVPLTVTTNTSTRTIELETGSFWVSTRQKNAGLAFVALEPENIDSYVSFNIIPMGVGDEYPIYRVMD